MNERISQERWETAQKNEFHHIEKNEAIKHYENTYGNYFRFTGVDKNLNGKSIVEIGPAKVAALCFCNNYAHSFIIEPTIYPDMVDFYKSFENITMIHEAAETCIFPKTDEAWLFNVLEHTIDPTEIVNLCKKNCDVIRFFEPLDRGGRDECHPHNMTREYMESQFGEKNIKIYGGVEFFKPVGFHQADCLYGIWRKDEN